VWMAAWIIVHLLAKRNRPPEPDDYAEVAARLRPLPKSGAGAVALEEPDQDDALDELR